MSDTFRALHVNQSEDKKPIVNLCDLTDSDLDEGDVTIRVEYSTLNYKDGLAITGKGPIIQKFPLIPGVDFAGRVISSDNDDFKAGDSVILNGWGVGEKHNGGLSERARVWGKWLVHMPEKMDAARAMAIGTAGYTAMLCVMALEEQGVKPEDGEILVTGAGGGVGSIAIALLADMGYEVVACTGRPNESGFLKILGAKSIIDRNEFAGKPRPLAKARWAGAVDVAGSFTLANILTQTKYGGTVAACGLAHGMDLPTSVAPFILRGVKLIGVESTQAPIEKRKIAWQRLANELDKAKLDTLSNLIQLDDVVQAANDIMNGTLLGRVVVQL